MKRRTLLVILAVIPALVGMILWLVFRVGLLPNYIVYMRVSTGILLLVMGLLLTISFLIGLSIYVQLEARFQKKLAEIQADRDTNHRQFLMRLDHELKNPLTAMKIEMGNLEAAGGLQLEAPLNGQFSTTEMDLAVERLKNQVMRMNDLVIHLRKLGELESHPIERESIRLDEMLNDLVEDFKANEDGARREITLSLPEIPWPLPEIEGDSDLIYLALRNVVGNAVKFSRPGDAIQIRAFEDANWVIVEIADQGPGIPEDELPYIWDELYRGKLAYGLPGSGLGLAIIKAIVLRHNGQVSLRSRLNRGTVVTIRIPAGL